VFALVGVIPLRGLGGEYLSTSEHAGKTYALPLRSEARSALL
jgi:hypothetical protein